MVRLHPPTVSLATATLTLAMAAPAAQPRAPELQVETLGTATGAAGLGRIDTDISARSSASSASTIPAARSASCSRRKTPTSRAAHRCGSRASRMDRPTRSSCSRRAHRAIRTIHSRRSCTTKRAHPDLPGGSGAVRAAVVQRRPRDRRRAGLELRDRRHLAWALASGAPVSMHQVDAAFQDDKPYWTNPLRGSW